MTKTKLLILLVMVLAWASAIQLILMKTMSFKEDLLKKFSKIAFSFLNDSHVPVLATIEPTFSNSLSTPTNGQLSTQSNLSTNKPQTGQPLIDKWALLRKYMTPNLKCPEMARVGSPHGDGGKWTCNPWRATRDQCIVYSLGSNGDVSFEADFYERSGYRCRIYSFDVNPQPASLFAPFNGIFMQTRVAAESDESANKSSLFDIMQAYGHSKLEILKMDIEESEFDVMDSFMQSVEITPAKTPFCQFLVEFHAFFNLTKKIDLWLPMFERLNRGGFRLFSTEPNGACCDEFSFMHLSCIGQYGLR